jgi:Zn finger protein HypA/HybF involved in hydrogenase expression
MHEVSIASSILSVVKKYVPPRSVLRAVHLVAGPMRAIEPDAMQFAWRAALDAAGASDVRLQLDLLPWTLRCPECGFEWTSQQIECACLACGGNRGFPVGGDELQVSSIEVDEQSINDLRGVAPCDAYR